MSITAKNLAKLLNLSEAAISMALNNKPGVSTKTRKRVIEIAKENGYDFTRINEDNTISQILNGTIHFIIYRKHGAIVTDTPFFSQLSEGIERGCKKAKYYLNINYLYEGENIPSQLNEFLRLGCRGIILLGTEMKEEDFRPFSQLSIPLVLLDNYFETTTKDCVLINNSHGSYNATNYLISRCKAQPGYLHSSYMINNFSERAEGFFKAVRDSGLSTSKSIVHLLSPSMEGAYADMIALIDQGDEISRCYFADNDLIAVGAIKAFRERGYSIPDDIAIVGFDNMPICTYIDPSLTTINVPKQYMGEIAIQRLVSIIGSEEFNPIKIVISTNLVKRKSV
jgi:LacI family transcriptional regulator